MLSVKPACNPCDFNVIVKKWKYVSKNFEQKCKNGEHKKSTSIC